MHDLTPFFRLTLSAKLRTSFTFFFFIIAVIACEEQDDLRAPILEEAPAVSWNFATEENKSFNKIKDWYHDKLGIENSDPLKEGETKLAWFMAEHAMIGQNQSITTVPVLEKGNESSLKTAYLYETEEGINGFILEQKPDKRANILLTDDFSGEISMYTLGGKLKSTSVLKNGIAIETKRTGIANRAMSTMDDGTEEGSDGIAWETIMDEVVITATRTGSNGGSGFAEMASFPYKPITKAFPGSTYNGQSQGMHRYSMPLSTFSRNRTIFDFNGNGPIVNVREVTNCFRQAGSGTNRSVTIYVEQPFEGSASRWNMFNGRAKVGHTFIKLSMTKYDGQKIEKIIGYYPKNESVNPISGDHTDEGAFRNDNNRTYDISVTIKNVSPYNFSQVLSYLDRKQNTTYNLNSQNCTDIGLEVARKAGRILPDPQVTWPFGGGSCPGSFGEALRSYSCNNCTMNKRGGRAYSSVASGSGC